jgi:hypothetical protein
MPAKKIKVIPLDTPVAEPSVETEQHPEATGMNEMINEIKSENTSLDETAVEVPLPEAKEEESVPISEPKPKAKRKPREPKKEAVVEAVPESLPEGSQTKGTESLPEPVQDVKTEQVEKPKADKETCPDCGKLVSAKTLKYSHKANCKANKEQPTITRAEPLTEDVAQDMVHNEVLNRMADARAARMQKKLDRFAKLTSQAF